MMIPLEAATSGRPVLVNLNLVRQVSADAKSDPPELHLQFEGGSIGRFRAIHLDGDVLGDRERATSEEQLLWHFRSAVASYQTKQQRRGPDDS